MTRCVRCLRIIRPETERKVGVDGIRHANRCVSRNVYIVGYSDVGLPTSICRADMLGKLDLASLVDEQVGRGRIVKLEILDLKGVERRVKALETGRWP